MPDWVLFTLIATAIYGFWGYFPKLGTNYLDPKSALVYEFIGIFCVTAAVLAFKAVIHDGKSPAEVLAEVGLS